ncbi:arylamine N-acetyltransferase [Micromonospora mangrovi]|uniref:Arylamine N-acetyltransferase n=2 Tax=Micromonospora TaxID=1873 RepID=A0AAU8HG64_9ACTN
MTPISDEVLARYLARLGVPDRPEPSLTTLIRLHERHVQRISYHNLDIQLGIPTGVDPVANAGRLAGGEAGYCFHLNGAFAALLSALGFEVTLHRGQVKKGSALPGGVAFSNHLAMTVSLEGRRWFVDVGLGDGLLVPVPLQPGVVSQPPFRFELARTPWGWRFTHDPRGSFTVMDWEDPAAQPQDFAEAHHALSTDPNSTFVRRFIVIRREAGQVLSLVDCVLTHIDETGVQERALATFEDWRRELETTFGIEITASSTAALVNLWQRMQHRVSAARQRSWSMGQE